MEKKERVTSCLYRPLSLPRLSSPSLPLYLPSISLTSTQTIPLFWPDPPSCQKAIIVLYLYIHEIQNMTKTVLYNLSLSPSLYLFLSLTQSFPLSLSFNDCALIEHSINVPAIERPLSLSLSLSLSHTQIFKS